MSKVGLTADVCSSGCSLHWPITHKPVDLITPTLKKGSGTNAEPYSPCTSPALLLPPPPRCSSEVSRLRSLVTLVDYMVAEAYVSVAISAMQALLNFFEDPSRVRVRNAGQ